MRGLQSSQSIKIKTRKRVINHEKMKYLFLLLSIMTTSSIFGQTDQSRESPIKNPNYDKLLSEKLGGDDYGMKN